VVNDRFLPANARLGRLVRLPPVRALFDAVARRVVRRPGFTLVPPRPPHCDFRTPEYATFREARREKWEATRGIGHSFGHNRNESPANFVSPDELVRSFADLVSKNGNLLLNVGPTAEGAIPEVQASRLRALGAWLRACGESVYGTRPWRRAEGETGCGVPVRFTARDGAVYALLLGTPRGPELVLREVPEGRVTLLGSGPLAGKAEAGTLRVAWPADLEARPVHALRIEPS
jgi:alpha-L-fucosidase